MYGDFFDEGSIDHPNNASKGPYAYVCVKQHLGRLAIVEIQTDEPLQFIAGGNRGPQDLAVWVDRLAKQWDAYFASTYQKLGAR